MKDDRMDNTKEEMMALMSNYPKKAYAGKKVKLDAEWKKVLVASGALLRLNVMIGGQNVKVSSQISEEYNEKLKTNSPIDIASSKNDLEFVFRTKNFLRSSAMVLKPELKKLHSKMVELKEVIPNDIYLYYVGADAGALAELDEAEKLVTEIDTTLRICYADAITRGGLDLEKFEKDTLAQFHTADDIKASVRNIYDAVDLSGDYWTVR